MAPSMRAFTIYFEGVVYEVSIDCRVTRTLLDLFIAKLPPRSGPSASQSSASLSASPLSSQPPAAFVWANNCVCSFGGQRLSLATPTEVAPTTLHVTWASRHGEAEKMANSVRVGLSKKRRLGYTRGTENEGDFEGYYSQGVNESNSRRSRSRSHNAGNVDNEHDASQTRSRSHWQRGTTTSGDEDDEDEDETQQRYDAHSSGSNSIVGMRWNDEDDDDTIQSGGDGGNGECNQNLAVLPFIVGGVVQLINTESRDKSHRWTVYIRGLFNETSYLEQCIESVRFILDPSFTPSERLVASAPFELTEEGWGEFLVKMKVQLRHYPRPIQVVLSSTSFSETAICDSKIKMASLHLSTQTTGPVPGLARGPVLSPVIDALSDCRYCSKNDSPNTPAVATTTGSFACKSEVIKTETDDKDNYDRCADVDSNDDSAINIKDDATPLAKEGEMTATLQMCPGTVMLSHLLRFSHRQRRGHCIPPLGRPYEPEEHIGYTIVQAPVITEQYDEIVVPDPPPPIYEVLKALPDMLRERIVTAKIARVMAQQQQHSPQGRGFSNVSSPQLESAFSEGGVSCWKYIMQEGPDDMALAESYLESVFAPRFFRLSSRPSSGTVQFTELQQQQFLLHGIDPAIFARPGRGRRKLTGAEIDVAALRTAKKGLEEAIEKMRRELTLRQAAHIYQQYT